MLSNKVAVPRGFDAPLGGIEFLRRRFRRDHRPQSLHDHRDAERHAYRDAETGDW